jgi:eukaryotic-like serine/threonine-protein kinase
MMPLDPLNIIGNTLGEYEIVSYRGAGAFGYVYEALHNVSGTGVALKILNPNAGWPQRREFDNEGSLLLALTGDSGVVTILDTGAQRINVVATGLAQFPFQLRYHVLELAQGSLDELLAELSKLDWPSRLKMFRDIVLGTHQMHQRNLVHRDLKAANCLLFTDGNSVTVKLSDLGRSRDLSRPAGATQQEYFFGRGDPNYAPPEMILGIGADSALSHRCADMYGIGSILFELAIGQGITGLALLPNAASIVARRSLPPDQRQKEYRLRLAETRSWYGSAFELFDSAVPKPIRQPAGQLIRQLCDPDPYSRLPRVAPGKRALRSDELLWLLRRADVLRLTMNNAIRQAEQLRSRKEKSRRR